MCKLVHLSVLHDVGRTIYYTETKQTQQGKKITQLFSFIQKSFVMK